MKEQYRTKQKFYYKMCQRIKDVETDLSRCTNSGFLIGGKIVVPSKAALHSLALRKILKEYYESNK